LALYCKEREKERKREGDEERREEGEREKEKGGTLLDVPSFKAFFFFKNMGFEACNRGGIDETVDRESKRPQKETFLRAEDSIQPIFKLKKKAFKLSLKK
jgi:hypothetical protein